MWAREHRVCKTGPPPSFLVDLSLSFSFSHPNISDLLTSIFLFSIYASHASSLSLLACTLISFLCHIPACALKLESFSLASHSSRITVLPTYCTNRHRTAKLNIAVVGRSVPSSLGWSAVLVRYYSHAWLCWVLNQKSKEFKMQETRDCPVDFCGKIPNCGDFAKHNQNELRLNCKWCNSLSVSRCFDRLLQAVG